MISSEKGYRISVNEVRNILKVRVWGIWNVEDIELAENFKAEIQEKVKEVSVNGKEWYVCEDLIELYPQSKEVCRIMGDGIVSAIKHGMRKAVHFEN